MTYTLQFLSEIEEDAISGYMWYEAKSTGLGEDFLRMFYASANEIAWNPLLHPKVYQDFRRRLLRRFPYAIYFTVEDDRIIIFGLFHCARNPHVVNAMLQNRETLK
ncbi:MAG: type II toxin-antitoxin system RelE/ParE family toxin [Nitrospirae bacterium]|nr:type II toxin-antitoxin system RelE/ParE family toxin [Nitrospirota bacterium]